MPGDRFQRFERRLCAAFMIIASLAGCGREKDGEADRPTGGPSGARAGDETAEQTHRNAPAESEWIPAEVKVVDLDGRPLGGMRPIATTEPNAFERPISVGEPTAGDGESTLMIPEDRQVYIRAWDPELKWFANNYIDIPPTPGSSVPELRIMMVRAGSLTIRLIAQTGEPVADTEIELMMFHPAKGPWWPTKAETDRDGKAEFESVPPGVYTVRIDAAASGRIELPDVAIDPGGHTDLGEVRVQ